MHKNKNRFKALTELGLGISLVVMLNLLGQQVFTRFDLTREKRFTLSKPSIQLADSLQDVLTVKVYLEGDFPADFKRLQKSNRDLLEEYKAYAGGHLEYEFIAPFEQVTGRDEVLKQFMKKGLQPTNIQTNQEDQSSQQIIVPGALVSYRGGREVPVNLMREQFGQSPEEVINQSIENLEYEFSSAFRKCLTQRRQRIAFTEGHGEPASLQLNGAAAALSENFDVERVNLNEVPPTELRKFDLMVVVKPQLFFNDYEKFKIDQYVMHGGKLMVFLENVEANMDSISRYEQYLTPTLQTGLDDLLFKYGVRVNYNLVSDRSCLPVQLTQMDPGGGKRLVLKPWSFYPVITEHPTNPITRNLEPILSRFAGSMDTVGNKDVHKTILLQTSEYSRAVNSPAILGFSRSIQQWGEPGYFNKSHLPIAVLLEGKFKSFFSNYQMDAALDLRKESEPSRMIVCADADLITNAVNPRTGETFPLGFDAGTYQRTHTLFGNKKFLLNCVDYLLDGSGLIEVRSKELAIRMLDPTKVKLQKGKWQLINMVFPVLMLLLFKALNDWIRNKKYGSI